MKPRRSEQCTHDVTASTKACRYPNTLHLKSYMPPAAALNCRKYDPGNVRPIVVDQFGRMY